MKIHIDNLIIKYKKFILGPINASLSNGINIVLGPNGSGKTTLFKTIAGILKPDNGSVKIYGDKTNNIGYLPQEVSFDESIKVSLLVKYFIKLLDLDRERLNELIKILELDNYFDSKIYELSGGLKRKLAIAIIMSTGRQILLLDEPFIGLDNKSLLQIMHIIKKLIKEKINIIISSHNVEFIFNTLPISSILILYNGKQLFFGDLKSLSSEAKCEYYMYPNINDIQLNNCLFYSICGQPRAVCPCNNCKYNNYNNQSLTIFDLYNCLIATKGDRYG